MVYGVRKLTVFLMNGLWLTAIHGARLIELNLDSYQGRKTSVEQLKSLELDIQLIQVTQKKQPKSFIEQMIWQKILGIDTSIPLSDSQITRAARSLEQKFKTIRCQENLVFNLEKIAEELLSIIYTARDSLLALLTPPSRWERFCSRFSKIKMKKINVFSEVIFELESFVLCEKERMVRDHLRETKRREKTMPPGVIIESSDSEDSSLSDSDDSLPPSTQEAIEYFKAHTDPDAKTIFKISSKLSRAIKEGNSLEAIRQERYFLKYTISGKHRKMANVLFKDLTTKAKHLHKTTSKASKARLEESLRRINEIEAKWAEHRSTKAPQPSAPPMDAASPKPAPTTTSTRPQKLGAEVVAAERDCRSKDYHSKVSSGAAPTHKPTTSPSKKAATPSLQDAITYFRSSAVPAVRGFFDLFSVALDETSYTDVLRRQQLLQNYKSTLSCKDDEMAQIILDDIHKKTLLLAENAEREKSLLKSVTTPPKPVSAAIRSTPDRTKSQARRPKPAPASNDWFQKYSDNSVEIIIDGYHFKIVEYDSRTKKYTLFYPALQHLDTGRKHPITVDRPDEVNPKDNIKFLPLLMPSLARVYLGMKTSNQTNVSKFLAKRHLLAQNPDKEPTHDEIEDRAEEIRQAAEKLEAGTLLFTRS